LILLPFFLTSLILISKNHCSKSFRQKLLKVKIHNLRDYSSDKRKRVDDRPYGGGLGMVMMIEPVAKALKK